MIANCSTVNSVDLLQPYRDQQRCMVVHACGHALAIIILFVCTYCSVVEQAYVKQVGLCTIIDVKEINDRFIKGECLSL